MIRPRMLDFGQLAEIELAEVEHALFVVCVRLYSNRQCTEYLCFSFWRECAGHSHQNTWLCVIVLCILTDFRGFGPDVHRFSWLCSTFSQIFLGFARYFHRVSWLCSRFSPDRPHEHRPHEHRPHEHRSDPTHTAPPGRAATQTCPNPDTRFRTNFPHSSTVVLNFGEHCPGLAQTPNAAC